MTEKNTVRFILDAPLDPARNMAIDDALYQSQFISGARPTLRFFQWAKPAISIGQTQPKDGILRLDRIRKDRVHLVRRPTGGGAVYHHGDLSYSLTLRLSEGIVPKSLWESYRIIHACVLEGLKVLRIKPTHLFSGPKAKELVPRGVCFFEPVRYDVTIEGIKVAGASQKRGKGVLLHQGSISLTDDRWLGLQYFRTKASAVPPPQTWASKNLLREFKKKDLLEALARGFESILGIRLVDSHLTSQERSLADRLWKEKYARF